jgi:hypothetical protein
MERFKVTIYLLIAVFIISLVGNIFQFLKNKGLTKDAEKLKEEINLAKQEKEQPANESANEPTNESTNKPSGKLEKSAEKDKNLKKEIEKSVELKQYTNKKYGFEIEYFTDKVPYIHDWGIKRNPNMPRRLLDVIFFDSKYGETFDHRSGIPAIEISVNECLPGENIDNCLPVVTSPCGTVPYGEIKKVYKEEGKFETSSIFNFNGHSAKRLKVACLSNEGKEGIAVLRGNRLYTVLFLSSSKRYTTVPKELSELMLSTFRFLE